MGIDQASTAQSRSDHGDTISPQYSRLEKRSHTSPHSNPTPPLIPEAATTHRPLPHSQPSFPRSPRPNPRQSSFPAPARQSSLQPPIDRSNFPGRTDLRIARRVDKRSKEACSSCRRARRGWQHAARQMQ
ncbi:hypothetical protein EJ06DRAFT_343329 [Trichodelitschia bisporula]|uniref:Uncharacterized protein n=1 Tax=Trichodelitschia bisporula TaxID=703511 RepID=A0A6G1I370_9PEZI|nr:hypothetical protein EJ06DRAFT_343329 [Trichodelitschia bisporula]